MRSAIAVMIYLSCSVVYSATISISCDYSSISNAVLTTAQEGDVVLIGSGSCTISNTITINRNISFTIKGSGTNQTTLISGVGLGRVIEVDYGSTNVFTISDLNLIGDTANAAGFIVIGGGYGGPPIKTPFHIYNIQMTNVLARGISMGGLDSFGLIDHCFFDIGNTISATSFQPMDFGGNAYLSWSNSIPYGTTNVVCVEDCSFRNLRYSVMGGGNGFWDGYNGMQGVIRHCIFDGPANNGSHGYDSQPTSQRTSEVYNNIFTNQSALHQGTLGGVRGGGFMWFSNTVYAVDTMVASALGQVQLIYYRGHCLEVYQGAFAFAGVDPIYTYTSLDSTNCRVNVQYYPDPLNTNKFNYPNVLTNSLGEGGYVIFGGWYGFNLSTNLTGTDRVKVGATLAETLTNISLALNGEAATPYTDTIGSSAPGYGTAFSTDTHRNHDFFCVGITTNSLTLRNRMDGSTNGFGWPAAFQPGVLKMVPYTNSGVVLFPCYSWSNVVYGSNGTLIASINFDPVPASSTTCAGTHSYITNLLVEGRDYFNNVIPAANVYTPLVYPHPLQGISSAIVQIAGKVDIRGKTN